MRFARTKLFGIFRDVFRAIGHNLVRMKILNDKMVSSNTCTVHGNLYVIEI